MMGNLYRKAPMKAFFLCIVFALSLFSAEYLTNKSCQECHPDIYDEYQSSWHSKTWFNDTLHREVAKTPPSSPSRSQTSRPSERI